MLSDYNRKPKTYGKLSMTGRGSGWYHPLSSWTVVCYKQSLKFIVINIILWRQCWLVLALIRVWSRPDHREYYAIMIDQTLDRSRSLVLHICRVVQLRRLVYICNCCLPHRTMKPAERGEGRWQLQQLLSNRCLLLTAMSHWLPCRPYYLSLSLSLPHSLCALSDMEPCWAKPWLGEGCRSTRVSRMSSQQSLGKPMLCHTLGC